MAPRTRSITLRAFLIAEGVEQVRVVAHLHLGAVQDEARHCPTVPRFHEPLKSPS